MDSTGNGDLGPESRRDQNDSARAAPVRSLHKGLRALDILAKLGEVRTTDLAEALDVDKGVASRILQTLALSGYAERVQGRRYVPGPKLARARREAGDHHFASIKPASQSIMNTLSSTTRESVYLAVLADDQVLYIDKALPQNELIVDRPIPTLAPRCCTAFGKLFSALMKLPQPTLRSYTPNSIVDPQRYQEELARIERLGYALDDEEFSVGVRCVAAPLIGPNNEVLGGVSVAAPAARLPKDKLDELALTTKRLAETFQMSTSLQITQ